MKKSDKERLKKVVEFWNKPENMIEKHNITREVILDNEHEQWAISIPLINIGEHVYQMSKEFKDNHPELPWSRVSGLRHRLVHDYEETNWDAIGDIVFEDMPVFIKSVEELLKEM